MLDILGGVELYVPQRMYYSDPEQGLYIDLQEGWQTLDGKNAENFVRFRSGYVQQDLGRINAQKIFLTALFEKVKASISISNTAKLTQVAGEISEDGVSAGVGADNFSGFLADPASNVQPTTSNIVWYEE